MIIAKLIATIAITLLTNKAMGHSGGLNAQGCHAGSKPYHCHRASKPIKRMTEPVKSPYTEDYPVMPIIKVLPSRERAIIKFSEDDFLEKGDRLYLQSSLGGCKVKVLATKSDKALISTSQCDFEVTTEDNVR